MFLSPIDHRGGRQGWEAVRLSPLVSLQQERTERLGTLSTVFFRLDSPLHRFHSPKAAIRPRLYMYGRLSGLLERTTLLWSRWYCMDGLRVCPRKAK